MRTAASTLVSALVAAWLACSALPAWAAGQVDVSWLKPEDYTDAGRSVVDRERTLGALGDYMQRWAHKLPDGQTLKIEVLDVNLAGEIEPFSWNQVRVVRGTADWPQMKLRYTLLADGRTLRSGEADLADMHYRMSESGSELGFEKRMLDKWFKATFTTR